jgi:carboxyl-terminal processing protease
MDPETAQSFAQELKGTFEGIGAEIGIKEGKLVVIAPLPGTPSDRAGLRAGDAILAIDKLDTTGIAVDYAVSLIRGRRGTKVTLTIQRKGETDLKTIEITRARIDVPSVRGELKALPGGKGQVAYLRVVHFAEDTDVKFREQWAQLVGRAPKGVVLDLRNDPGGYLNQAIALASHWVGEGVIVREQGQPPQYVTHESVGPGDLSGVPTVILVNQGSASASEIVTGALQDYRLATVVGEQTFGKGSVQDIQQFDDGSQVKLTIAKWFTPQGRSIDTNGLKPDIEVKFTKEDADKGLDPQLDRALELLTR